MPYQIHHQNIIDTSKTKICFDFEAESAEDFEAAIQKAWDEYPPEKGFQFLMCKGANNNAKSKGK